MQPVLVLASHTMGLGVIRALGMMGVPIVVVHYDLRGTGYISKYVTESIRAPHPEACREAFIDVLVELASRFKGALLLPTSDASLSAVSRYKRLLEQHCIVGCTEWEITEKYLDKKHTYALAHRHGIPAPKTTIPTSREEVVKYGEVAEYPCLVKPSQSHLFYAHFKAKMIKVNNLDHMLIAYQQAVDAGFEVVLQEWIPGDDASTVNYNSYFWNGQPLVEFTAQQIRKAPPWLGSPRVVLSKHIPEVLEPGRQILRAMGFYGYSCVELKKDARDGSYKLIEVNGRHNLSTLLAVHCGINFPWLQYRHLVQGELPSACGYRTGVYWIDMARDIGYSIKYIGKEGYSLGDYVRPYLQPHLFAVLDATDPRPFLKRCLDMFRKPSASPSL